MSCEIYVIYPGLEGEEIRLEIPETSRAFGIVSFGSDPTVCFGSAPGMGGFVLDRWEAEEYGILPRHCALLWAGGKFRLEFDRHAGVYLNGSDTSARSFCNPFEDGPEFEMRLGLPTGSSNGTDLGLAPVFRIRRTDRARRKSGWLSAVATRFKWFRKAAMIPFLVSLPALVMTVIMMGLAFAGWNFLQDQRITEAFNRAEFTPDISKTLAPSVASIGLLDGRNFKAFGTAWLYEHRVEGAEHSSRWLVTNVHVIEQMGLADCTKEASRQTALARFPSSQTAPQDYLEVPLLGCPVRHPLYTRFASHTSSIGPKSDGQQSVANIYDIAAFKLETNNSELIHNRKFLTLESEISNEVSLLRFEEAYSQNIEPGRPVLILSYPTENQPFLTDGVSTDPFQFRTSLQSKSNAMSRRIPGSSSNRNPALYSFSAKSAGGMSGSPVIALDRNRDPFVTGMVFSASFVRGSAMAANGSADDASPIRLPAGDGTYALDTTGLATLHEWGEIQLDAKTVKQFELNWDRWLNGAVSLDDKRHEFEIRNKDAGVDLQICAYSETAKLSRKLTEKNSQRGETQRAIPYRFSGQALNTLVTVEVRSKRDDDALVQLAVRAVKNGNLTKPTHRIGLNQATYLRTASRDDDAQFTIAGPLNAEAVITIYEAIDASTPCPTKQERMQ